MMGGKKMKKYTTPEVELLVLTATDVLMASGETPVVPGGDLYVGDVTAEDIIVAGIGLGDGNL